MNRVLRNLLIIVAVVVVVGLGRHFSRHSATTTTTSTTSTTSTSTTVPTSTTTATVSATTCRGAEFTGTNLGSEGAAGTGYDTMTLLKDTAGTCVVDSYPLLTLQGAKGAVVSGVVVSGSTDFPTAPANAGVSAHTISDGEKLNVEFRYSDVPVGSETCPSVAQVDVQFVANDTTVPVSFPYPITLCTSAGVGVSAFYPS